MPAKGKFEIFGFPNNYSNVSKFYILSFHAIQ